jgi:hypothetical protein
MFEVVWQRPQDYDIDTGLADPYSVQPGEYKRSPQQSRVYVAHTVTSEFTKGSFTQQLEGALYLFPVPGKDKPAVKPADTTRQKPVTEAERAAIRSGAIADNPREVNSLASRYPPPPVNSTTGSTPTSSTAKGVQSTLNPPKTLAEPTLAQLQASPAYIAARRSGQTPEAALQAARQSFGAQAGGSPVTSNGQAVATNTGNAAGRLPPSPNTVTPANVAAARRGESTQSPTTPTIASNQKMAITR